MPAKREILEAHQLGAALVLLRELQGHSQAQMARAYGVRRSKMSEYETGVRMPDLKTVAGILESLGEDFTSLEFALGRVAGLTAPEAALKSLCTLVRLTYLSTEDRGRQTAAFLERLRLLLKNVEEDEGNDGEGETDEAT